MENVLRRLRLYDSVKDHVSETRFFLKSTLP